MAILALLVFAAGGCATMDNAEMELIDGVYYRMGDGRVRFRSDAEWDMEIRRQRLLEYEEVEPGLYMRRDRNQH